jgi:hypothetical protein
MPKPRRKLPDAAAPNTRTREPPRHALPLPAKRLADVGFVWDSNGRIIAPWPRHALWPDEEARLLAVLARIDTLKPDGPCWVWPDPNRAPQPVEAPNPHSWLARRSDGRASYVARREVRRGV